MVSAETALHVVVPSAFSHDQALEAASLPASGGSPPQPTANSHTTEPAIIHLSPVPMEHLSLSVALRATPVVLAAAPDRAPEPSAETIWQRACRSARPWSVGIQT